MNKQAEERRKSLAYMNKMQARQAKKMVDEDKTIAEMFETQNRMMKAHMENVKLKKKYNPWIEKVWVPFQKKEKETQAKQQAELAEKRAKQAEQAKKAKIAETMPPAHAVTKGSIIG